MNDTPILDNQAITRASTSEMTVLDLLIVIAKHKKLVIGLPMVAGIVAAAVSFALPNVYRASTKLLPPQQAQSGAAALLSQLGGAASMVAGAAGIKNPNDMYIGMLKSRTVADRIVHKFDLQKVYDEETLEKTRRVLEENTTVLAGKDGLISIDVEDKDPKRVAQMANAYVAELTDLTKVLAVTEASQRRLFFERQLELAKDNLAKAEMTLKRTLDTRGVISVDSDSRAIVETVGRLRAQISAKEIQLSSMQAFVTTDNQEYRRAREELNSLRNELSKLENGRPELSTGSGGDVKNQVGLENIKTLRDVKYFQMLYELLAKQYEVARLDEAKDNAVIQVLDPAVPAEQKSRPKRAIIILMSMLAGFFAALGWSFVVEIKARALAIPEGRARWARLKTLIAFK
ncbi:MAG: hypothetical protein JWP59_4411 [Massilia sp.]|jgi:tyrosine-protein kinase Etk/Wzc|nr:hypothetical protein [Massilia sp.]